MDLVLDKFDDWLLDDVWARLLPVKLPVDEFLRSNAKDLLSPTSPMAQAATATAYASSLLQSSAQQQEWTTVSLWPREDWRRQFLSLCVITMLGIHLMYFVIAGLSYRFIFDHRMMQHPRFLKNQVQLEIKSSLTAFPWLTLLTVPVFVLETQGYTKCYDSMAEGPWGNSAAGWAYLTFSLFFFLWFTDCFIYFIHRAEHHPLVYKWLHKPHHKWLIPTPFASHAFHPLDGYAQSLPYHAFIFLFPLHKYAYLGLFAFVNLWTIAIHDSDMICDHPMEHYVNGPAHHSLHHLHFNCNYGQFFVACDKYFGSFRKPRKADDPLIDALAAAAKKTQLSSPVEEQTKKLQ